MQRFVRLSSLVEHVRGSMWFLPSISVVAAIVVGAWLSSVEVADSVFVSHLLFPGGADGARGILQAIAGSTITVTSLTFSLTVVALQLASSQFSPRLLRTFLRQPGNQVVLSVFLATFVYSLVVLRGVRAGDAGADLVPELAVTGAFLLALGCVAALVWFLAHITTAIRVDELMHRVHEDTVSLIHDLHPPRDGAEADVLLPPLPPGVVAVPASASGVVQAVNPAALITRAAREDIVVRLAVQPGDRIVAGGVIAWICHRGDDVAESLPDVDERIDAAVTVGHERTMQQDTRFGLRQLVDIAAKALSPGVNDPTTAVDAVGHVASIVTVLARRRVGDQVHRDDEGVVRVEVPGVRFGEHLATACGQVRRYGASEPAVVVALLHLLLEVAHATDDDARLGDVEDELELLIEAAQREIVQSGDLVRVQPHIDAVRTALDRPAAVTSPPYSAG